MGRVAAVHHEEGAADEGALVAGQEERCVRTVQRAAQALDEVVLDSAFCQLRFGDAQLLGVQGGGRGVDGACGGKIRF